MNQSDVRYGDVGQSMQENMRLMELLYGKFYRRLYLYALTFLEDQEDARDVVSELFVQLWNKWEEEKLSAEQPSATYLYAMLRNRCIDIVRHRDVESRYLQQLEQDRFESDDDVQEYEDTIALLCKAIQLLPEPGKTILHCCYFKRMTYQQTADKLKISLPMVKKHMVKVFQTLRDKLKNDKDGRTSRLIS